MTTARKAASNGRNALQSTGPRTLEGKAISSKNARKHGLLSEEILLPNEDSEALSALGQRLREALQPVGELETVLVDRIVALLWRLARLGRVEAGIFTWYFYEELVARAERKASSYEKDALEDVLTNNTVITDRQKHEEALDQARGLRNLQEDGIATFGPPFVRDASGSDAFSKLSRYETTIDRSLHRALHELQRLQAARNGMNVPPPIAVDVEVDPSACAKEPGSPEGLS
jgi:hypothetical protein